MRIISGSCRGRKLVQIEGQRIRPTSDRTREAIFNILGPKVRHARVLDLFAGTGAFGIEAVSRGAKSASFVDISCKVIKKNLTLCRLEGQACVYQTDIIQDEFPKPLFSDPFDIVFMDPPYGKGYIDHVMQHRRFFDLLCEGTVIVAEHSHKEKIEISVSGLDFLKQKKYSKTKISIFTATGRT